MDKRKTKTNPIGRTRLYSASEKQSLIKKLIASKRDLTWSKAYEFPDVASEIPSRRTLFRIFKNPQNANIRDSTARKIENLLNILQHHDAEVITSSALARRTANALRRIIGTTPENSRTFLERYAGCFKSIRLTTRSKEILVSHVRIFEQAGGSPAFVHVEVVPDEAGNLPDRPIRVLEHRGFILLAGRLAHFVSPHPDLRQLTCLMTSNDRIPTLSGILVTKDAVMHYPFAARVFVEKTGEIDDEALLASEEYGLFSVDDDRYCEYLPYITNDAEEHAVVFAVSDI